MYVDTATLLPGATCNIPRIMVVCVASAAVGEGYIEVNFELSLLRPEIVYSVMSEEKIHRLTTINMSIG
jgi:hypothetical protein